MAVAPLLVARMSRRAHLYGFCGRAENVMVVPAGAPPPVVFPQLPPKVSAFMGIGTWPSPRGGLPGAIMGRHGGECTDGCPPPWTGNICGAGGATMTGWPVVGSTP